MIQIKKHAKRQKNTKIEKKSLSTQITFFLQNRKEPKREISAFSVIAFEPIKIDCLNLSFVKDVKVVGKKTATNGHKADFCQWQ